MSRVIVAVTSGVVFAAVLLVSALSVAARPAKALGTSVNVIEGKPSEFRYTLSLKSVPLGTVTFKVTDSGTIPHDFKVCSSPKGGSANTCTGTGTIAISPGGTATLKVTFKKAGTYEYVCTLPGHAAAGMKGDLKVT